MYISSTWLESSANNAWLAVPQNIVEISVSVEVFPTPCAPGNVIPACILINSDNPSLTGDLGAKPDFDITAEL